MPAKRLGRQTVRLSNPVSVVSYASIGGKLEAQGPLAGYFDELSTDSFFGCKTWEKGEAAMQRRALERALQKGGLSPEDLDYILAGDLLNQCIGTSFSLREFRVPFYGLYGACSTMANPLITIANQYVADGKTSVDWCFSTMPSEEWKNGVGSALTAYAAGTGKWDDVVTAFVDGWAKEYKLANG